MYIPNKLAAGRFMSCKNDEESKTLSPIRAYLVKEFTKIPSNSGILILKKATARAA